MKFISHLDMQRFMIRMIRRSGIPVWYSEGFNPHPYITFALPLSLAEMLDGFAAETQRADKIIVKAIKNALNFFIITPRNIQNAFLPKLIIQHQCYNRVTNSLMIHYFFQVISSFSSNL